MIVGDEDDFCVNCGEDLDEGLVDARICSSCGSLVEVEKEECPECGKSFATEEQKEVKESVEIDLATWEEIEQTVEERLDDEDITLNELAEKEDLDLFPDRSEGDQEIYVKRLETGFMEVMYTIRKILSDISEREEELGEDIEKADEERSEELSEKLSQMEKQEKILVGMNEDMKDLYSVIQGAISKEKRSPIQSQERLRELQDELNKKEGELKRLREEQEREGTQEPESLEKTEGLTPEEWREEQKKVQQELFKLKDYLGEDDIEGTIEDLEDIKDSLGREEREEKEVGILPGGDVSEEEIKTILGKLDELLGDLPQDKIEEFAKSDDFDLYKQVLDAFGV